MGAWCGPSLTPSLPAANHGVQRIAGVGVGRGGCRGGLGGGMCGVVGT